MEQLINNAFDDHLMTVKHSQGALSEDLIKVCSIVIERLKQGNKIFLCGNGGSASDAQHIAAEFVGRFLNERRPLPAIALTTDTSALTAISNDYGFDRVFERQVNGLATKGDVLIGLSTSGNSSNVINALKAGKSLGCFTIGLSGNDGGAMNDHCDINLVVPSNITARIQEMHILIGHIICAAVDANIDQ
jgi:D-sedoheptulose 7-phosphate isomerase